jgi:hypothetical protein
MSEHQLTELFERAGTATPVSSPPLARIAAGARSRRRRRLVGQSGLAIAGLAFVVGSGWAFLGSVDDDLGQPATPPQSALTSSEATPPTVSIRGDLPSDTEKAEYIASLETTVLPVIEDLQVEYFMDEPDCANLTYARGDYIDGNPEHCGGSTDHPAPFDDVVRADHARVAAALEESRTPIERAGGNFIAGDLRYAFFMSTHGAPFATSWDLLYDPDDLRPKTATELVTFTPVSGEDGWWFVCCSD